MTYMIGKRTEAELNEASSNDIKSLAGLEEVPANSTLSALIQSGNRRVTEVYNAIESNFYAGYVRTAETVHLDALAADDNIIRFVYTTTSVPCLDKNLQIRTTDGSTIYDVIGNPAQTYKLIPKGVTITSSTDSSVSPAYIC